MDRKKSSPRQLCLVVLVMSLITGTVTLKASLKDLGDADAIQAGFGYRPYAGFVEELYDDTWLESEFITLKDAGEYEIKLKDLKKDQTYQFRAAVKHPRITMHSNIKRFKTP